MGRDPEGWPQTTTQKVKAPPPPLDHNLLVRGPASLPEATPSFPVALSQAETTPHLPEASASC